MIFIFYLYEGAFIGLLLSILLMWYLDMTFGTHYTKDGLNV